MLDRRRRGRLGTSRAAAADGRVDAAATRPEPRPGAPTARAAGRRERARERRGDGVRPWGRERGVKHLRHDTPAASDGGSTGGARTRRCSSGAGRGHRREGPETQGRALVGGRAPGAGARQLLARQRHPERRGDAHVAPPARHVRGVAALVRRLFRPLRAPARVRGLGVQAAPAHQRRVQAGPAGRAARAEPREAAGGRVLVHRADRALGAALPARGRGRPAGAPGPHVGPPGPVRRRDGRSARRESADARAQRDRAPLCAARRARRRVQRVHAAPLGRGAGPRPADALGAPAGGRDGQLARAPLQHERQPEGARGVDPRGDA